MTTGIEFVRLYVGASPEDAEITELLESYSSAGVARIILQQRLADMAAGPSSFSVSGYSESYSAAQMELIRDQINELSRIVAQEETAITQSFNIGRTDARLTRADVTR